MTATARSTMSASAPSARRFRFLRALGRRAGVLGILLACGACSSAASESGSSAGAATGTAPHYPAAVTRMSSHMAGGAAGSYGKYDNRPVAGIVCMTFADDTGNCWLEAPDQPLPPRAFNFPQFFKEVGVKNIRSMETDSDGVCVWLFDGTYRCHGTGWEYDSWHTPTKRTSPVGTYQLDAAGTLSPTPSKLLPAQLPNAELVYSYMFGFWVINKGNDGKISIYKEDQPTQTYAFPTGSEAKANLRSITTNVYGEPDESSSTPGQQDHEGICTFISKADGAFQPGIYCALEYGGWPDAPLHIVLGDLPADQFVDFGKAYLGVVAQSQGNGYFIGAPQNRICALLKDRTLHCWDTQLRYGKIADDGMEGWAVSKLAKEDPPVANVDVNPDHEYQLLLHNGVPGCLVGQPDPFLCPLPESLPVPHIGDKTKSTPPLNESPADLLAWQDAHDEVTRFTYDAPPGTDADNLCNMAVPIQRAILKVFRKSNCKDVQGTYARDLPDLDVYLNPGEVLHPGDFMGLKVKDLKIFASTMEEFPDGTLAGLEDTLQSFWMENSSIVILDPNVLADMRHLGELSIRNGYEDVLPLKREWQPSAHETLVMQGGDRHQQICARIAANDRAYAAWMPCGSE